MPQLPQETRDRIVDLFRAGVENKTELARRTGTSKPTVYKVLEEEGLYEPPGITVEEGTAAGEDLPMELIDRVGDLHEEGYTAEEIAEELEQDLETVEEILAGEPGEAEEEDDDGEEDDASEDANGGYDAGYGEGHKEGYKEGYAKGYESKHGRKPLDLPAVLLTGVFAGAAGCVLLLRRFPNLISPPQGPAFPNIPRPPQSR